MDRSAVKKFVNFISIFFLAVSITSAYLTARFIRANPAVFEKPDFLTERKLKEKKLYFFNYLYRHIAEENKAVEFERNFLLSVKKKREQGFRIPNAVMERVKKLVQKYEEKSFNPANFQSWDNILTKVDTVPAEIAISQSAIESAYGSSRFALEANNLFGQHCFQPNCGLPSLGNVSYDAKIFPSHRAAVREYIRNINTHPAYKKFRNIRKYYRDAGKEPDIKQLSCALRQYSDMKTDYTDYLNYFIDRNIGLLTQVCSGN